MSYRSRDQHAPRTRVRRTATPPHHATPRATVHTHLYHTPVERGKWPPMSQWRVCALSKLNFSLLLAKVIKYRYPFLNRIEQTSSSDASFPLQRLKRLSFGRLCSHYTIKCPNDKKFGVLKIKSSDVLSQTTIISLTGGITFSRFTTFFHCYLWQVFLKVPYWVQC